MLEETLNYPSLLSVESLLTTPLSHAEVNNKYAAKKCGENWFHRCVGRLLKIYQFSVFCDVYGSFQLFFPNLTAILCLILYFFLRRPLQNCVHFSPHKTWIHPGGSRKKPQLKCWLCDQFARAENYVVSLFTVKEDFAIVSKNMKQIFQLLTSEETKVVQERKCNQIILLGSAVNNIDTAITDTDSELGFKQKLL